MGDVSWYDFKQFQEEKIVNEELSNYAREKLKEGLARLPEGYQMKFKQMYAFNELDLPIEKVVDIMADEKLDHALTLVKNSVEELNAEIANGWWDNLTKGEKWHKYCDDRGLDY